MRGYGRHTFYSTFVFEHNDEAEDGKPKGEYAYAMRDESPERGGIV